MMKTITLILAAVSLLWANNLLAAPSQQYVEMEYEAKAVKRTVAKSKSKIARKKAEAARVSALPACTVVVSDIIDKRQNTVTLGATGAEPLISAGLEGWLLAVKDKELVAKTATWSGVKQIKVVPSLTKLYVYSEHMNIHGVISLNVAYWLNDQLFETRHYRGMGAKANMMNAMGEYATSLNYAVHDVAPLILNDLKTLCSE